MRRSARGAVSAVSHVYSDQAESGPAPIASAESLGRSRLAAVIFTDVVGYSERMGRDEVATIAAVHADFTRMREACAQFGGEVLNTMGDGMMLCFASAVDAVTFALQIQGEFGKRNAERALGQGLTHRMGIHIGDVRPVEGGHMAGDGVNIAARLEPKAPKGGICVSQIVYDTVKRKVPPMRAECMGPQTFKNIAEPIIIWRILPEGSANAPAAVHTSEAAPPPKRWVHRLVIICLLLFAADMLWPYRDRLGTLQTDIGAALQNAVRWVKALIEWH